MKRSALTILMLVLLALPQWAPAAGWKEIAPQRVYDLLKEGSGLWLIDVRGAQDFEAAHIEGAVNIPAGMLATKSFPKRKILIVADASLGQLQAKDAAAALVRNGQERVFVLAGGIAAWEREGLPIAGTARAWEMVRLLPADLARAMDAKVPLRLFDLRDEAERKRGPVDDARSVGGKDLSEKLAKVKVELEKQKKSLSQQLKSEPTAVIVLPAAADASALYRQYLWRLPVDVRVMEGGYLASAALREKKTLSNIEGCATCPGN